MAEDEGFEREMNLKKRQLIFVTNEIVVRGQIEVIVEKLTQRLSVRQSDRIIIKYWVIRLQAKKISDFINRYVCNLRFAD